MVCDMTVFVEYCMVCDMTVFVEYYMMCDMTVFVEYCMMCDMTVWSTVCYDRIRFQITQILNTKAATQDWSLLVKY